MILMIVFKSLCSWPNYRLFPFHISTRREDILLLLDIVFCVLLSSELYQKKTRTILFFSFWGGLEGGLGVVEVESG